MGRRFPPQLRVAVLHSLLWQRRPLRSSGAPSLHPALRSFACAAATPSSRPPSLPRVPLYPLRVDRRSFCCTGSPDIVVVQSAEEFENSLKKVQEDAQPAVFYFSATWCGPCKFLAPVMTEISKMYPSCVTYKIDIDMDGIQNKLSELGISAVPTLNFYKDGKMAATVTGADVQKIKAIMDEFYK